jgi:hypothetical protein
MKKSLLLGLSCLVAMDLTAATRFDGKTWNNLRTYEARDLSGSMDSHLGELVAIKFTFRSKGLRHLKPNWYESAVWQIDPKGKKGFSSVRVMVAKKDVKAFKALPTDSNSSEEITVYGKVARDMEANFFFVRLIGRNASIDPAGSALVSW